MWALAFGIRSVDTVTWMCLVWCASWGFNCHFLGVCNKSCSQIRVFFLWLAFGTPLQSIFTSFWVAFSCRGTEQFKGDRLTVLEFWGEFLGINFEFWLLWANLRAGLRWPYLRMGTSPACRIGCPGKLNGFFPTEVHWSISHFFLKGICWILMFRNFMYMSGTTTENTDFKNFFIFRKKPILPERTVGIYLRMKLFDCANNMYIKYSGLI